MSREHLRNWVEHKTTEDILEQIRVELRAKHPDWSDDTVRAMAFAILRRIATNQRIAYDQLRTD